MITAEIAGYEYETDKYCPDCIHRWVKLTLLDEGYWRHDDMSTEALLNVLALLWDVDREYADPDDFPVPFSRGEAREQTTRAIYEKENPPLCNKCKTDLD